ncbi:MAG: flagellar hook capping protein [Lachnospiraceae bacterium]|nr:flagellar hook capping protein [Lachnospiraceae bacterium]
MSLVAPVENGKFVETASQTSVAKSSEAYTKNNENKDMFLQLLVAEVKNQDPLEPTSNTEWISQYATFSELEAMTNMSASYDLSRASALVGKTAIVKVTGSDGETNVVQGKVDYVTYENGDALLSIGGSTYSLDDLYNVLDDDYVSAYDKVYDWTVSMNKLPSLALLSLDDKDKVDKLYDEFKNMSDYEKTFVAKDNETKVQKYHDKIEELMKVAEAGKADDTTVSDKDESTETEESAKTEEGTENDVSTPTEGEENETTK